MKPSRPPLRCAGDGREQIGGTPQIFDRHLKENIFGGKTALHQLGDFLIVRFL